MLPLQKTRLLDYKGAHHLSPSGHVGALSAMSLQRHRVIAPPIHQGQKGMIRRLIGQSPVTKRPSTSSQQVVATSTSARARHFLLILVLPHLSYLPLFKQFHLFHELIRRRRYREGIDHPTWISLCPEVPPYHRLNHLRPPHSLRYDSLSLSHLRLGMRWLILMHHYLKLMMTMTRLMGTLVLRRLYSRVACQTCPQLERHALKSLFL